MLEKLRLILTVSVFFWKNQNLNWTHIYIRRQNSPSLPKFKECLHFLLFIFGIFFTHTDTLFISLAPRVLPCRCLQHAQDPVHALRSRMLASITWRKDWNTDEILGAHPGIRLAQSICHAPNTIGLIMGHHFHSFQNPRVGGLWGQILKQLRNLPSRRPLTIQLLALVQICSPAVFKS